MANIVLKDADGQNKIYQGITSIVLPTTDGKTATFIEQTKPNYVTGGYVTTVLEASKWNGTTYILTVNNYGILPYDLQLSIPPVLNSPANAKAMIENALIITNVINYPNSTDDIQYEYSEIYISALETPIIDIRVAIWGIENGGGESL